MFVCVLVVFPKMITKGKNAKHLKKMFSSSKLSTIVYVMMLKHYELGNWSTLNAALNVASFDAIVGVVLRPNMVLLNIQCVGNWQHGVSIDEFQLWTLSQTTLVLHIAHNW